LGEPPAFALRASAAVALFAPVPPSPSGNGGTSAAIALAPSCSILSLSSLFFSLFHKNLLFLKKSYTFLKI
jgi:hypothetical protein